MNVKLNKYEYELIRLMLDYHDKGLDPIHVIRIHSTYDKFGTLGIIKDSKSEVLFDKYVAMSYTKPNKANRS